MGEQGVAWHGADERTGRYLVSYASAGPGQLTDVLRQRAGLRSVAASSDFGDRRIGIAVEDLPEVLLFPRLSAAVLTADPDRLAAVCTVCEGLHLSGPEPERWVYAEQRLPPVDPALLSYLSGYRDGVASVVDRLGAGLPPEVDGVAEDADADLTWGLRAVGVPTTGFTGRGVKVAVLDTGLDAAHPDMGARAVESASFVRGEGPQDALGHGTHCAGTLCGPVETQGPTRYGVAPEVELYVGKVLGDDGRGREGDVLAGIDWAVERGCRIVSMSLGSRPVPGEHFSAVFEDVAAELAASAPGVVLVAAAGNDSDRRRGRVAPVGRPASCPSAVAVAAVDRRLEVAWFSNAGAGPGAGQIDVAGPGVDVLSAYPQPRGPYAALDGTSMATPHVAGVLALLAESRPQAGVPELVGELSRLARRLPAPSVDVGSGLVQAPCGPAG
jgi:subtilisin family serine protease